MRKILIIGIIILSSLYSLSAPELSPRDRDVKYQIKNEMRELKALFTAEFSEDNLRRLLELLEIEHIDIIIKQAKIESGWYKSRLFIYENALFGMHYPEVRDTYSDKFVVADRGAKVASYASWQSSTLDFILRMKYYKSLGYSTDDYYNFLHDTGYCELGGEYIKILKQMS